MFQRSVLLLSLIMSTMNLSAQSLGTWNILNIKYKINEKWNVFGESQIRSLRFYDHYHYYENKIGFEYKLDPEFRLALAIGDYDTYTEGGK